MPSDRVFISLRRRPGGDYGPLTPSGVEQLIQDLGVRAGISKRVYPHLLRHSYATWALNRGMNPVMLAHILGHTSLAMIQNVYSHLTPTDAYEAMVRTLAEEEVTAKRLGIGIRATSTTVNDIMRNLHTTSFGWGETLSALNLGRFQEVTLGQSFHWTDKDAVAEIVYDSLVPGESMLLIYHEAPSFGPGVRSTMAIGEPSGERPAHA